MQWNEIRTVVTAAFVTACAAPAFASSSAFVKQATPASNTVFVKQASQVVKRAQSSSPIEDPIADQAVQPETRPARASSNILEFEVPDERMLLPSARISPLTRAISQ